MANKFLLTLNSGNAMPALGFGTYAPQHVSKKIELCTSHAHAIYTKSHSPVKSWSACA